MVDQVYYKHRDTAILNPPVILPSYLHSCEPPIIHGNLTCDTIFIQHNGLIKIGSGSDHLKSASVTFLFTQISLFSFSPQLCLLSLLLLLLLIRLFSALSVAPDTINNHVKTCREEQKSLHFFAPEYGGRTFSFNFDPTVLFFSVFSDIDQLNSAFSCCQCYHSRGYLFLWNVRLRGERSLALL